MSTKSRFRVGRFCGCPERQPFWRRAIISWPRRARRLSGFISAKFVNALLEDREPSIDVYEGLAMTVPGIVAHQSALKDGEQLAVPQYDPA